MSTENSQTMNANSVGWPREQQKLTDHFVVSLLQSDFAVAPTFIVYTE